MGMLAHEFILDDFVVNALKEPCQMEDVEDGTLLDCWIHGQFVGQRGLETMK
jgi:hypothetical protein